MAGTLPGGRRHVAQPSPTEIGRQAAFNHARRAALLLRRRRRSRTGRAAACAEYVDALCSLPGAPPEQRDAALARLATARGRYRQLHRGC